MNETSAWLSTLQKGFKSRHSRASTVPTADHHLPYCALGGWTCVSGYRRLVRARICIVMDHTQARERQILISAHRSWFAKFHHAPPSRCIGVPLCTSRNSSPMGCRSALKSVVFPSSSALGAVAPAPLSTLTIRALSKVTQFPTSERFAPRHSCLLHSQAVTTCSRYQPPLHFFHKSRWITL